MSDRRRSTFATALESGFSLIEIMIAMFMLLLMSIGLLPLLWNLVLTSTQNRANVAATTYANTIVSSLRDEFGTDDADNSCAALKLRAASPAPPPAGSNLTATVEGVDPAAHPNPLICPAAYPGTVAVAVKVTSGDLPDGATVELRTEFLVTGA